MAFHERFVVYDTGTPTALKDTTGSVFGASGTNHSPGLVPDPGSSAGTTRFLREDATFQAITTSSVLPTPTRAGDIIYWNGSTWVTLAGNNSGTQFLQENSSGVPNWSTISYTAPTYQKFTSGSGNYTPTSGSVLWIKVRMCGGGGGGGAATTNDGSAGGNTSFGSWTAIGGSQGTNGGSTFTGGAGGTGGAAGTGTLIVRLQGGNGSDSISGSASGSGGVNPFGGCSGSQVSAHAAKNGIANTGAGGSGVGNGSSASGAGGAGEYVEFLVSSPGTIAYAVGAGGGGGAAGSVAGGNGAAGIIIVEEFYQ